MADDQEGTTLFFGALILSLSPHGSHLSPWLFLGIILGVTVLTVWYAYRDAKEEGQ